MFSLFPRHRSASHELTIPRRASATSGRVSSKKAMSNSAVWAAIRLRASLESTLPIDVFRRSKALGEAYQIEPPSVLVTPDCWDADESQPMRIDEWLYARRVSLDLCGNAVGIKTHRDANDMPARIHLVDAEDVTIRGKGGRVLEYKIGHKTYEPKDVWHDRQYVVAGSPLGLSPIAHAALSLTAAQSAAQFTIDWFDRSASPSMVVKHTKAPLDKDDVVDKIRRRLTANLHAGEPMVLGSQWEVQLVAAKARDAAFLELADHSAVDVARFFNVPARVIDAVVAGQSITYANITQDLLSLLVLFLGPTFVQTEKALSALVPGGFVKLISDALLRMDPEARRRLLMEEYTKGLITADEYRRLNDLPPLPASEKGTQE